MPAFSISYDVSENSSTSYEKIEKVITDNCNGYCKYAETSWIVTFSGNASDLSNKLTSTGFGKGDCLLVIKVINEYQGWLNENKWDTIRTFFK